MRYLKHYCTQGSIQRVFFMYLGNPFHGTYPWPVKLFRECTYKYVGVLSGNPKANLTWPLNISILAIFHLTGQLRFLVSSITMFLSRAASWKSCRYTLLPFVSLLPICLHIGTQSPALISLFPAVLGAFVQDCRNIPEAEPSISWLLLFEWVGWQCLPASEIMPAWKRLM